MSKKSKKLANLIFIKKTVQKKDSILNHKLVSKSSKDYILFYYLGFFIIGPLSCAIFKNTLLISILSIISYGVFIPTIVGINIIYKKNKTSNLINEINTEIKKLNEENKISNTNINNNKQELISVTNQNNYEYTFKQKINNNEYNFNHKTRIKTK